MFYEDFLDDKSILNAVVDLWRFRGSSFSLHRKLLPGYRPGDGCRCSRARIVSSVLSGLHLLFLSVSQMHRCMPVGLVLEVMIPDQSQDGGLRSAL